MGELCRDDLQGLAEGINREHALVESHLQGAVQHAIRAGGLLAEAKGKVPHGEWLPWLAENCAIKERTAQTYMRLARELPKLEPSKAQRVADLPLREAVSYLSSPGTTEELYDALCVAAVKMRCMATELERGVSGGWGDNTILEAMLEGIEIHGEVKRIFERFKQAFDNDSFDSVDGMRFLARMADNASLGPDVAMSRKHAEHTINALTPRWGLKHSRPPVLARTGTL